MRVIRWRLIPLAVLPAVGLWIGSCAPSGNGQDVASGISPGECTGVHAAPSAEDSIAQGGLNASVDLDCDGSPETLSVYWTDQDGLTRPQVAIGGSALSGAVVLPIEGLPQFVTFGDLTGNGFRDLVLALVDESVVMVQVVLVSPQGLQLARLSENLSWRDLQYLWDPEAIQQGCEDVILPQVEIAESTSAQLVIAHGDWSENHHCLDPQRTRLQVVNGMLVESLPN